MNVKKRRCKLNLKFKKKGYEKTFEDEDKIIYSFLKSDENGYKHRLVIHKINGIYFIYIEILYNDKETNIRYASIPKDVNKLCLKLIKLKRKG